MKYYFRQEYLKTALRLALLLALTSCDKCKRDNPQPSTTTPETTTTVLSQNTLGSNQYPDEYIGLSFGRKLDNANGFNLYQEIATVAYVKNDVETDITNKFTVNDSILSKQSFYNFYYKNLVNSKWLSNRSSFNVKIDSTGNLPKMNFEIKNLMPDSFHITAPTVLDTTKNFEVSIDKQFADADEIIFSLTSNGGLQGIDKIFVKGDFITNKTVFTVADMKNKFTDATTINVFVSVDKVVSGMVNGKKVFVHMNSETSYDVPLK